MGEDRRLYGRTLSSSLRFPPTTDSTADLPNFLRPGRVQVFVLEVPKDFPTDFVGSIGDSKKMGAKILAARGVGVVAVPTPSPSPPALQ